MSEFLKKSGIKESAFWIVFLIIYISNDTLLFGTNENRIFFYFHIIILLCLFIYLLLHVRRLNKNSIIFSISYIFCMFLTMIVNKDSDIIKYIYNIFIILLAVLITHYLSADKFITMFTNVMYILSIFSVTLFIVGIVFNPSYNIAPFILNENKLKYYFFGLGFLENLPVGTIPRMYSIFREPGVFVCYLILALLFEIFSSNRTNIKKVLLFFLAAFTTFSTAAFSICFLCLIFYTTCIFFSEKPKERKKMYMVIGILTIVISGCILLIGVDKIYSMVFNKLYVENASRDSRFGSIAGNFNMFMTNPLIGRGWNFVENQFIEFASTGVYAGTHNTNTFLKLLALYGVYPFISILTMIVVYFRKRTKSIVIGLFLTMIWIITLSNEDFSVNIMLYILPFYAFYTNKSNKINNKERR